MNLPELNSRKRVYERVFFKRAKIRKRCSLDRVVPYSDYFNDSKDYVFAGKRFWKKFYKDFWDYLVKMNWYLRLFGYDGENRRKKADTGAGTGIKLDFAFGMFIRFYIGIDHRIFFNSNSFISKISSYVDDFYPELMETNAFKQKFKFPFKYVSFEHMIMVYQLDNRMELLNYAEKKKMHFLDFIDFVIDYCYRINEQMPDEKYEFIFNDSGVCYMKTSGYKQAIIDKVYKQPKKSNDS